MKKKIIIGFSLLVALTLLAACQSAPEKSVVRSKNDGYFEDIVAENVEPSTSVCEFTETLSLEDFNSSDGSVQFSFACTFDTIEEEMPVVKVTPHYITEKEAEHVAHTLFGDVVFYDGSNNEDCLTKDEIKWKIQRWSSYAVPEAIQELLGREDEHTTSLVQAFLKDYTLLEENAIDKDPDICTWKYSTTASGNNEIKSRIVTEDASYSCWITVRDQDDFKLSNISVFLDEGASPGGIDENIFRANLCRTVEPTDEQISNAREKAEAMLRNMNLGEWVVDESYVETAYFGEVPEYYIQINAVPLLNNVAANRMPQLTNLKSKDAYASNLYLSDVNFTFSSDGKLVRFKMYTPIDIQEVANPSVQTLTLTELIDVAKQSLVLTDAEVFGLGLATDFSNEELSCNVRISEYSYGLSRIDISGKDGEYYYVPALTLKGIAEFIGQETGNSYTINTDELILICLNAVDGTVINDTH